MSSPARLLAPYLVAALTSTRTRDARRWLAERRRRLRREPHRVLYFHQVDDSYGQLVAQVLPDLLQRFDVELVPHLAGPPPDAAAPERARLAAYARKDAADVAPSYGLFFPLDAPEPRSELVSLAEQTLARAIADPRGFAALAPRVGDALWSGDEKGLYALARTHGAAKPEASQAAAVEGSRLRARLGHYSGAMLHYAGEWYWGVDRLHHLERRLTALGALRAGADAGPLVSRPDFSGLPGPRSAPRESERPVLEFFLSLRSPYTCIAMPRVFALARRLPVELRLRPVLPMVMRGLAVPREKRLYITLDTKREADDAGVPFGRVSDPVGRPVERGFSLWPFARAQGREAEYLHAFARAAFAEGVDTGSDAGLRHVVERAGLAWADAAPHLDREGWRDELEENRVQLFELGLWGVPSFRILGPAGQPDFCTWGQDRLWLVEAELRRRLAG